MDDKKGDKNGEFVDVGRAETEIYEPDPEIAEVFESDQHGHGAHSGSRQMQHEIR